MPTITKTVQLELEVTVGYDWDPADIYNAACLQSVWIEKIKGMDLLLQLNGAHRHGSHPDGSTGMVLDIDSRSSIAGELKLKPWIDTSTELDAQLREAFEDAIEEQENERE